MKIGIGLLVICCVAVFFGIRSQTVAKVDFQITGTVIDDKGAPIEGARISAVHLTRPLKGRLPNAYTDTNGRFTITGLEAARYHIMVEKEKDGYPDFTSIAYTSTFTLAEPTKENPSTEVAIQMGPKAAQVLGKVTAKSKLKDTRIKICLVENPEVCSFKYVDDDGAFAILAPPEKEFTLTVSSEGFQDYKLKQKILGISKDSLILKAGERHHAAISLN